MTARICGWLALVTLAAAISFWIVAFWTADDRWNAMGLVAIILAAASGLVAMFASYMNAVD